MTVRVGEAAKADDFPSAASKLLGNVQLRRNVRHATDVITTKRAQVVSEISDWQELRESARQIKEHTLRYLDFYLEQFEETCVGPVGMCIGLAMPTKPTALLREFFRHVVTQRSSRSKR